MPAQLKTSIISSFVGGSDKATFPNIQGCAISQNMMTEVNGEIKYQRSLYGKKFYKAISSEYGNCYFSFFPSVGMTADSGRISSYWVFGSTLYRLRPSGVVEGVIYNLSSNMTYGYTGVESGGEIPYLLFCTGERLYAINLLSGLPQLISMPTDIAGNTIVPTSVACIAGSIIVSNLNTGYAYYSQPYILSHDTMEIIRTTLGPDGKRVIVYKADGVTPDTYEASVWDGNIFYDMYGALQYKNAESSSDNIVRLTSIGDILTVFGSSTIEFWIRGEVSGMTWQRTNYTANGSLGIKTTRSVGITNNIICFLGNGNRTGYGVFAINRTEIQKISPVWLDEIIFKSNNVVDSFGYGYSYGNHNFYCLHIIDESGRNRCFTYDFASGDWHERVSQNVTNDKLDTTHYVYPIFTNEGKLLYGNYMTQNVAAIYEARDDYWYEDITDRLKKVFIRMRQTPLIIDSYKRFILNALSIEGNFGMCYDRSIQPQCMLEISRDGGRTFGNLIVRNLPKTGEYKRRVDWNGLGMVRDCVIKFSTNAPMDLVLSNASMTICPLNYRY